MLSHRTGTFFLVVAYKWRIVKNFCFEPTPDSKFDSFSWWKWPLPVAHHVNHFLCLQSGIRNLHEATSRASFLQLPWKLSKLFPLFHLPSLPFFSRFLSVLLFYVFLGSSMSSLLSVCLILFHFCSLVCTGFSYKRLRRSSIEITLGQQTLRIL